MTKHRLIDQTLECMHEQSHYLWSNERTNDSFGSIKQIQQMIAIRRGAPFYTKLIVFCAAEARHCYRLLSFVSFHEVIKPFAETSR